MTQILFEKKSMALWFQVQFAAFAMALRKSDSVNWTLVLVLVLFSSIVHSRPQVDSSSTIISVISVDAEKPTEAPIRYSYKQNDVIHTFNLSSSLVPSIVNFRHERYYINNKISNINATKFNVNNRTSRVTRKKIKIRRKSENDEKTNIDNKHNTLTPSRDLYLNKHINKPTIKKVVTKWMDSAKFEDLVDRDDISSEEDGKYANSLNHDSTFDYSSTNDQQHMSSNNNKRYSYTYTPRPTYSEETDVHSTNFHIISPHNYPHTYVTRPNYLFTTPTPTPIITNVGYPPPWPNPNIQPHRPITRKPTKPKDPYNYHNTVNNFSPYPGNNFDVTTFPPTSAYTDRIVIRPEEYNGSSDDCPTIFLTLNNTFQGQAKEACPDLNIAVNTNVVNKNVVIESEEDTDTTLTDVFGLPIEDSGSEEESQDYAGSQENDEDLTESASIEGLELSNYNAANSISDIESSESANLGSPNSPISAISRPDRPSSDDDVFSLSSLIEFFRPAVSAFSWLAAINPFSFSALSFFLTPIILLFAGISSLFAPLALSAREAQHIHIYRPDLQWNDNYKNWHFNSFPDSRGWQIELPRSFKENYKIGIKATWFAKLKEFLKKVTTNLNKHSKNETLDSQRKNKRKKRETWTIRVK